MALTAQYPDCWCIFAVGGTDMRDPRLRQRALDRLRQHAAKVMASSLRAQILIGDFIGEITFLVTISAATKADLELAKESFDGAVQSLLAEPPSVVGWPLLGRGAATYRAILRAAAAAPRGGFSTNELAAAMGRPYHNMRRLFLALVAEGLLSEAGVRPTSPPTTVYRITPKGIDLVRAN